MLKYTRALGSSIFLGGSSCIWYHSLYLLSLFRLPLNKLTRAKNAIISPISWLLMAILIAFSSTNRYTILSLRVFSVISSSLTAGCFLRLKTRVGR